MAFLSYMGIIYRYSTHSKPVKFHNIKWDYFEILAFGKTDLHCRIKETSSIQELQPSLNANALAVRGCCSINLNINIKLLLKISCLSLGSRPFS